MSAFFFLRQVRKSFCLGVIRFVNGAVIFGFNNYCKFYIWNFFIVFSEITKTSFVIKLENKMYNFCYFFCFWNNVSIVLCYLFCLFPGNQITKLFHFKNNAENKDENKVLFSYPFGKQNSHWFGNEITSFVIRQWITQFIG